MRKIEVHKVEEKKERTMLLGISTTCRKGRLLSKRLVAGGHASPLSAAVRQLSSTAPDSRTVSSSSSASASASPSPSANWPARTRPALVPPIRVAQQYFHTTPNRPVDAAKEITAETTYRALSPDIRAAIIGDLNSVDFDKNGKIDAEELKALLRRHNESFTEGEILELSQLFYSSLGANSVEISRFVEALDAVAALQSTSGGGEMGEGESVPLVSEGAFKTHPLGIGTCASEYMYSKTHGKYTPEDLDINLTHVKPKTAMDRSALFAVKCVRTVFDFGTGWNRGEITTDKILNRAIFLETIAAVPGMVAAVIRHFRSLRNMTR